MAGTIPYMSPEQIRGKPGFASDQYALGIIAYEWLCGTRPFVGTTWQILQQHLDAPPPSLREKKTDMPQAIEEVVQRALAKDPRQRFVSVQAFAHALERASHASHSGFITKLKRESASSSPSLPDRSQPDSYLPYESVGLPSGWGAFSLKDELILTSRKP
jgi:serine/threonine protein kinase